MSCHPARWLWGLIPVAMLGWLAVHGKSDVIAHDLEQRSAAALSAAGHDWASVAFSGRDGLLVGHAASEADIAVAADLVRGVWGVRVVDVRAAASDMATVPPLPQPSPTRTKSRPLEEFVPIPVAALGEPDALLTDGGPRSAIAAAAASGEPALSASRYLARAIVREAAAADPVRADGDAPGDVTTHIVLVTPMSSAEPPASAPSDEKVVVEAAAPEGDASAAEKAIIAADTSTPAEGAVAVAEPSPAGAESGSLHETPVSGAESADASPPQATAPGPQPAPEAEPEPPAPSSDAQYTNELPAASAAAETPPPPAPALPERKHVTPSVSSWALEAGSQVPPTSTRQVTLPNTPLSPPTAEPKTDPEQAPRFETAALPQGNMDPDAPCTEDVRGAAKQVEVHFARGDARLDRSGKALLERLIVTLEACPTAALRIAGHADATGVARRNLALSKRRARTVVSYLVDKGIDAGRLAAVGYGQTRPVAPNTTRANRARNRRIEVDVTVRASPPVPVRKQGTHNGLSHR